MTLRLEDDLDISRGDTIVGLDPLPGHSAELAGRVLDESASVDGREKYFLKHGTQTVQAMVTSLESRIDFETFEPKKPPNWP